ncbi:tRNA preQ1(34) S-adenosylmethionine ribosyltransferase-isomerase QueA [Helicobacter cynogastricus]|uniref:tRNA preQ1(34) S-adenosylmethionine ribosyltransferase-isomerase QueA n=1 Tax=Helicobacter cynogastricus TaxID=329937 RepID=UPI000CF038E8|nr:tRNA preQ1(34) S-adenosylmethionine ribosyltransferase-isomerase QueA [Helicobacter cynogastricus]
MSSIPKEFLRTSYHYELGAERIASTPLEPPEHAKLLVYERARDRVSHSTFTHVFDFFPPNALIVLNDTKVIKARLYGRKKSGGKVELLIHHPLNAQSFVLQIKGRVPQGGLIELEDGYSCEVLNPPAPLRQARFYYRQSSLNWEGVLEMLECLGHVPIPPYLKRADTPADERAYQSVFAKHPGAIAAPTASLHFSERAKAHLLSHFKHAFLTLHVGAGTFLGVECEDIREHPMHAEALFIPQETRQALDCAPYILCVGTTALRGVEHYKRGNVDKPCNLFLHPGNPVQYVHALLTNFHLPESTLLMLVASMVGLEKCLQLYQIAKDHAYRFYSYGDGMLIL